MGFNHLMHSVMNLRSVFGKCLSVAVSKSAVKYLVLRKLVDVVGDTTCHLIPLDSTT